MGPKQHHLYSKPEYTNSQHASFYCNIHHNMLHFTAISTTTCLTLLQYTPQPGSFYCNITTCLILLQYQSQHASFYCNINHNMLHFTAISTTTCFILLEHASFHWNTDVPSPPLGCLLRPCAFAHLARRLQSHHQRSYVSAGSRLRGARGILLSAGPLRRVDLQHLPLQRVQEKQWGQKDKLNRGERGYRMAVLT